MSTIPLPALSIRPPQEQPGPLDTYAKLLQLRQMQNQGQTQQLQQTALSQENQQRQVAINDQAAASAAMKEWSGKDMSELPTLLQKHGASATAIIGMKQNLLKYQTDLSNLTKDQLANEKVKNDYFAQAIDNVKQLPAGQQAAAFEAAKQDAIQKGHLDPQQAQSLQYQGPDQLDALEKSLMGHSAAVEQAAKQAQTAEAQAGTQKNVAQTAEAEATTAKTQKETEILNQFGNPSQQEAKYIALQQKKNLNQSLTPEETAFTKAYEKQKTLVPTANFNLQNAGTAGNSALAKAVADGTMKWGDVISPRTPMSVKQAFAAEVKGINPQFNSGDFDVEKKVREDFTSGADSNTLNSINRAREHMKVFLDKAADLDNGNVKAFNALSQAVGTQFGSDKAGNFTIAKQAFSSEVGKAFAGASVAEGDRKEIGDKISAASSFQQLAGVAKTADQLLAGAQKVLKEKYQQGLKAKPNFGEQDNSTQHVAGGKAQGLKEGQTGMGSDGKPYVVKNGIWVLQ